MEENLSAYIAQQGQCFLRMPEMGKEIRNIGRSFVSIPNCLDVEGHRDRLFTSMLDVRRDLSLLIYLL